jgi:hypothetical protein
MKKSLISFSNELYHLKKKHLPSSFTLPTMDIMFNIILTKLKIDINNNEILKTKWEHDKKK